MHNDPCIIRFQQSGKFYAMASITRQFSTVSFELTHLFYFTIVSGRLGLSREELDLRCKPSGLYER